VARRHLILIVSVALTVPPLQLNIDPRPELRPNPEARAFHMARHRTGVEPFFMHENTNTIER
jgi:hypothetical protein